MLGINLQRLGTHFLQKDFFCTQRLLCTHQMMAFSCQQSLADTFIFGSLGFRETLVFYVDKVKCCSNTHTLHSSESAGLPDLFLPGLPRGWTGWAGPLPLGSQGIHHRLSHAHFFDFHQISRDLGTLGTSSPSSPSSFLEYLGPRYSVLWKFSVIVKLYTVSSVL